MARINKTVKCNRLFIPEFGRVLTKIMKVKINVTDGFKKGRNHSMPWDLQGEFRLLIQGCKAIHPQKAWKGLFLLPKVMNSEVAHSSPYTQQHLSQHSPRVW